ncbi:MAG: NUDIX hydrolase [Planctomycetota bacterium]
MPAKFCSACGALLVVRSVEGRERTCCDPCAVVHYENPVPAAAVAVLRQRQVLLCRRAIEPYLGQWGLPAGFQEVDENIETTALREVREESGLIVRLTGLLDVLSTSDDPRKPSLLVIYSGEEVEGELEPGSDADEAAFHSLDRLPQNLSFRNHRIILERLRKGAPRTW